MLCEDVQGFGWEVINQSESRAKTRKQVLNDGGSIEPPLVFQQDDMLLYLYLFWNQKNPIFIEDDKISLLKNGVFLVLGVYREIV